MASRKTFIRPISELNYRDDAQEHLSSLIESTCQAIETTVEEAHGRSSKYVYVSLSTTITMPGHDQRNAQMKYYYYLLKELEDGGYDAKLLIEQNGKVARMRITLRDDSAEMQRTMDEYVKRRTLQ